MLGPRGEGGNIISCIYISQQLLLRAENASACQGDSQPGFEEFSSLLDIGPDRAAEKQENFILHSWAAHQFFHRRDNTGRRISGALLGLRKQRVRPLKRTGPSPELGCPVFWGGRRASNRARGPGACRAPDVETLVHGAVGRERGGPSAFRGHLLTFFPVLPERTDDPSTATLRNRGFLCARIP